MNLLHISSSPRGADSESLRIAEVFTDDLRREPPDAVVDALGPLGRLAAGHSAPARRGQDDGLRRRHARRAERPTPGRGPRGVRRGSTPPTGCCSACRCGTPASRTCSSSSSTWCASPAGSSASTRSTGYRHLLAGRGTRVAVIYTSAVWGPGLGPEFGRDFQSTYFDRLAALDRHRPTSATIRFHPTLTGDRAAEDAAALARARDVAKTF